jgi:hypothetical protein
LSTSAGTGGAPVARDNFLHHLKGTPSARQAEQCSAEVVCRDAEISRVESRVGAEENRQSRGAAVGRAYSGAAVCRALRAGAHRARRCHRPAFPAPQAGGTSSNASR